MRKQKMLKKYSKANYKLEEFKNKLIKFYEQAKNKLRA
jgi:hypothetical protein